MPAPCDHGKAIAQSIAVPNYFHLTQTNGCNDALSPVKEVMHSNPAAAPAARTLVVTVEAESGSHVVTFPPTAKVLKALKGVGFTSSSARRVLQGERVSVAVGNTMTSAVMKCQA
jgi:hypothetical protein